MINRTSAGNMDPEISNHNMPIFDTIKIKPKRNKCLNKGSPDFRDEALEKKVFSSSDGETGMAADRKADCPPPQFHRDLRGQKSEGRNNFKIGLSDPAVVG